MLRLIRTDGLENALSRFYANYESIVTDNTDDSQVGRVSVKVYSLGLQNAHPRKAWPVSPYAGRNYGFYFPAHVDDQVLVSFDHGSISSPQVVGAFWPNQDDAHKPATSHVPAEFVNADGGAPTRRGIRSRGGSVMIFDDDPNTYHFEIYTGAAETEEIEGKTRPKVGELSKKHHRLLLDDANEEISIASFGVGEEDDAWADRRHHELTMRDKEDDRFIELRSAGADSTERHSIVLSDELRKILLESHNKHIIEISDEDKKILLRSNDGHLIEIDEDGKKITSKTVAERSLVLNDTDKENVLTEAKSTLTQNASGTKIETDGAFNVQAATGSLHKFNATLDVEVASSWTQRIAATAKMLITGSLTITAASVTISSNGPVEITAPSTTISPGGTVMLGTGAIQTLMNLAALTILNTHTHKYIAPLLPIPGPPLETLPMAASVPLVPASHATVNTKAG